MPSSWALLGGWLVQGWAVCKQPPSSRLVWMAVYHMCQVGSNKLLPLAAPNQVLGVAWMRGNQLASRVLCGRSGM